MGGPDADSGDADRPGPCGWDRHDFCVHVGGAGILGGFLGDGERADPATQPLCGCPCHLDCPMSGQSSGTGWPDRCTCQGTLLVERLRRGRDRPPDLKASLRDGWERGRRRRKARDAVRSRIDGHSREDISRMIRQEWTGRGLDPPVEPILGMEIDRFIDPGRARTNDVRVTADVGKAFVRASSRLLRLVREDSSDPSGDDDGGAGDGGGGSFRIQPGTDTVEVALGPGAEPLLERFGADGFFTPTVLRASQVELRLGLSGDIEVWQDPRDVDPASAEPQRLGVVRAQDAGAFLGPVAAAERVHQPASCQALRSVAADGSWRLHVRVPATR